MSLYRRLLRPMLFRADAEWIHDRAVEAAERAAASPKLCSMIAARCVISADRLATRVAGLDFANPLGLGAGFDKNGRAAPFWAALGFGHVEVGSISADFSAGNARPRLFRIPEDRGIVVNYGLPNDGADRVARRLYGLRPGVPLGVNLVNTNRGPGAAPESDDAVICDYVRSLRRLSACGDYFTLNLSCPNTRDGRAFVSDAGRLRGLLDAVAALKPAKPVFLKVAPFGDMRDLDAFLEVAGSAAFVSGFAVNLPPGKPAGLMTNSERLRRMPGAVGGKPCEAVANQAIADLYRRVERRRHAIIGAGGVFSAQDAYIKIRLGASLVQLLTALVYEGPGIASTICNGLAHLLARDGFSSVRDAVGVDADRAPAARA
jgi:dihydroorotate dehydrogenase (fumarate)/dihydroorotate dehydrogenase